MNSTKASQPNDKKRKPRLTKEEDEERRKKREERKKKQEEAVKRFNKFMGKRKLKDWQKLCKTIGLKGEFKSIQSCREVCILSVLLREFSVLSLMKPIPRTSYH